MLLNLFLLQGHPNHQTSGPKEYKNHLPIKKVSNFKYAPFYNNYFDVVFIKYTLHKNFVPIN